MSQYTFIDGNNRIAAAQDVDRGGDRACVGTRGMWELSVPSTPSTQFLYESKTALRKAY